MLHNMHDRTFNYPRRYTSTIEGQLNDFQNEKEYL